MNAIWGPSAFYEPWTVSSNSVTSHTWEFSQHQPERPPFIVATFISGVAMETVILPYWCCRQNDIWHTTPTPSAKLPIRDHFSQERFECSKCFIHSSSDQFQLSRWSVTLATAAMVKENELGKIVIVWNKKTIFTNSYNLGHVCQAWRGMCHPGRPPRHLRKSLPSNCAQESRIIQWLLLMEMPPSIIHHLHPCSPSRGISHGARLSEMEHNKNGD